MWGVASEGAAGGHEQAVSGRLPAHYVLRSRLIDPCRDERILVLEASAGDGKSVLAAELVNAWGAVPVDVVLEEGGVVAPLLASRLRAAVGRVGFVDAAASMATAGQDPVAAIDAMLDALSGESCAIVIDDAHHALRDAGAPDLPSAEELSALPVAELAARLAQARRLIAELTAQAGRLSAQVERLSARVEELERQAPQLRAGDLRAGREPG